VYEINIFHPIFLNLVINDRISILIHEIISLLRQRSSNEKVVGAMSEHFVNIFSSYFSGFAGTLWFPFWFHHRGSFGES
jgi:hypothetical protein